MIISFLTCIMHHCLAISLFLSISCQLSSRYRWQRQYRCWGTYFIWCSYVDVHCDDSDNSGAEDTWYENDDVDYDGSDNVTSGKYHWEYGHSSVLTFQQPQYPANVSCMYCNIIVSIQPVMILGGLPSWYCYQSNGRPSDFKLPFSSDWLITSQFYIF